MGRTGAASTLASYKQRQNEWQQRIDGPNQINTAESRELGVTDILSRLGFAFQRWVALCLVPLGICGVENSSIRLASARSNDRHNSNVISHSPIVSKRRNLLKKASSYQTETKHRRKKKKESDKIAVTAVATKNMTSAESRRLSQVKCFHPLTPFEGFRICGFPKIRDTF